MTGSMEQAEASLQKQTERLSSHIMQAEPHMLVWKGHARKHTMPSGDNMYWIEEAHIHMYIHIYMQALNMACWPRLV